MNILCCKTNNEGKPGKSGPESLCSLARFFLMLHTGNHPVLIMLIFSAPASVARHVRRTYHPGVFALYG